MGKFRSKFRKKYRERPPTGSRTGKKLRSFLDRKSDRGNERGRETEERVALLLAKKQTEGELTSFKYHQPHGPEDRAGKDFTVTDARAITASFAVTISPYQPARDVPLIIIPPEMSDERIWQRICRILQNKADANEARA